MRNSAKLDFRAILRILKKHRVKFVVVGGISGALHGAPVNTLDLDVVHSRDPENVARLIKALKSMDAHYRTHKTRKLRPVRSHLESPGHQLLTTNAGPLDLLGVIGKGHTYEDLLQETIELDAGKKLKVRVLNLAALIRIKAETATEKDRAQLAILRRTLEEKNSK